MALETAKAANLGKPRIVMGHELVEARVHAGEGEAVARQHQRVSRQLSPVPRQEGAPRQSHPEGNSILFIVREGRPDQCRGGLSYFKGF